MNKPASATPGLPVSPADATLAPPGPARHPRSAIQPPLEPGPGEGGMLAPAEPDTGVDPAWPHELHPWYAERGGELRGRT